MFGDDVDDLFINVVLPDGWQKKPTDHSMWSDLVDERGRKRANIFYKAAFYDRSAHLNLVYRYTVSGYESCNEQGDPAENYNDGTHYATCILDCGKLVKIIAIRQQQQSWGEGDAHSKIARDWLDKNYPDHKSPLAYWDVV